MCKNVNIVQVMYNLD